MAKKPDHPSRSFDPADLFPMIDGRPNPRFAGKTPRAEEREEELTANRRLRNAGWLPIRWHGTLTRFRELGIEIQVHRDTFVQRHDGQGFGKQDRAPGRITGEDDHWGPAWAVLVAEAEPCNETARDWALARGAIDNEFRDALMTIAIYGDRRRMADYVMEVWNPAEGDDDGM